MAQSSITGIDDLMRLLEQVERTPARVLTGAVKKAANIAKAEAKALAPKSSKSTGNLRKSIVWVINNYIICWA